MIYKSEAVKGSDDTAIRSRYNTLWRVAFPDQSHEQGTVLFRFSEASPYSTDLSAYEVLLLLQLLQRSLLQLLLLDKLLLLLLLLLQLLLLRCRGRLLLLLLRLYRCDHKRRHLRMIYLLLTLYLLLLLLGLLLLRWRLWRLLLLRWRLLLQRRLLLPPRYCCVRLYIICGSRLLLCHSCRHRLIFLVLTRALLSPLRLLLWASVWWLGLLLRSLLCLGRRRQLRQRLA